MAKGAGLKTPKGRNSVPQGFGGSNPLPRTIWKTSKRFLFVQTGARWSKPDINDKKITYKYFGTIKNTEVKSMGRIIHATYSNNLKIQEHWHEMFVSYKPSWEDLYDFF